MSTRAYAAKRKGHNAIPVHPKRTRKLVPVSYREESDEETSSSDDEPLIKQAALRCSTRVVQSRKKAKVSRSRKSCPLPTAKRIPWNTLPYQIWLQIFMYEWDLSDTRFKNVSRIAGNPMPPHMVRATWLFRCALVCRDFAEPALSALYHSPPLHPAWKAHALIRRLKDDPQSSFKCCNKVQYLTICDPLTFGRKHIKHDPISLADIITYCPQLRGLLVSRSAAVPLWQSYRLPQRGQDGQGSTRDYNMLADTLMAALESNDIRLREWHWAGYNPSDVHGTNFEEVHQSRPFQALKHLTISSIRSSSDEITPRTLRAYEEDAARIAAALALLPALQSVRFNKCMTFTTQILPSFPATIQLLEITDCSLTSEALSSFLMDHGRGLRKLILDHNDTLNLAFLSTLAMSCPRLEALHMDLRFFQQHLAFNDSEPKFEQLLPSGLTPTWPTTLRSLELFHLRKWATDAAGRFFDSLVNASISLTLLRRLKIKASIEESAWRTRVTFRDSWIKRLNAVFKRPWSPPKTSGSLQSTPVKVFAPRRREKKSRNPHADDDEVIPAAPFRRSLRLKDLPSASPAISTPSEDSHSEDCRESDFDVYFVQGMCDVVDIAIDNLRPAAEQLNEDDFLDEEASGDSDWSEGKENRRLDAEERNAW